MVFWPFQTHYINGVITCTNGHAMALDFPLTAFNRGTLPLCGSKGRIKNHSSKLEVVGKVVIHRLETNEPGEDR